MEQRNASGLKTARAVIGYADLMLKAVYGVAQNGSMSGGTLIGYLKSDGLLHDDSRRFLIIEVDGQRVINRGQYEEVAAKLQKTKVVVLALDVDDLAAGGYVVPDIKHFKTP